MSENFTVEIISPDKSILKSEANEVTIPSYEGQMGILKDHIPLITFLRPGLIEIKESSGEKKFFIEDGNTIFKGQEALSSQHSKSILPGNISKLSHFLVVGCNLFILAEVP